MFRALFFACLAFASLPFSFPKKSAPPDSAAQLLSAARKALGTAELAKAESWELQLRREEFGENGTHERRIHVLAEGPVRVRLEECLVETWEKGGTGRGGNRNMPTARGGGNPPGPISPMRQEELCHFAHAEGYDEQTGHWLKAQSGVTDHALNSASISKEPYSPLAFLRAFEALRTIETGDAKEFRGERAFALQAGLASLSVSGISRADTKTADRQVMLFINRKSNVPLGLVYRESTDNGESLVTEVWADYRIVKWTFEGRERQVSLPWRIEKYSDGTLRSRTTLLKIKVNGEVSARRFARPR